MAKPLVISNKIGLLINNLNDWQTAFIEIDNDIHWKEGRSAWALAKYFTTPSVQESYGISTLQAYFQRIIAHDLTLSHAEIEHESKFDAFRGKGRMHDLIIWGQTNEVNVVICIEAKVDETFGDSISVVYKKAEDVLKTSPNSKCKERIENLCSKYSSKENINSFLNIKYQLLYFLEGSITEAKKIGGIVFMPVLVFHTDSYNRKTGINNKKDYDNFIEILHFEPIDKGKGIYKIERSGVTAYTSYIEIKL